MKTLTVANYIQNDPAIKPRWAAGTLYSPYLTQTKLFNLILDYKVKINKKIRTTAGKIHYDKCEIHLHEIYFGADAAKWREDFLHTFFHEVSHAIAYHCKGEPGHGPVWQHIFANFGYVPTRCHVNGAAFIEFKDQEVNDIADGLGNMF